MPFTPRFPSWTASHSLGSRHALPDSQAGQLHIVLDHAMHSYDVVVYDRLSCIVVLRCVICVQGMPTTSLLRYL